MRVIEKKNSSIPVLPLFSHVHFAHGFLFIIADCRVRVMFQDPFIFVFLRKENIFHAVIDTIVDARIAEIWRLQKCRPTARRSEKPCSCCQWLNCGITTTRQSNELNWLKYYVILSPTHSFFYNDAYFTFISLLYHNWVPSTIDSNDKKKVENKWNIAEFAFYPK